MTQAAYQTLTAARVAGFDIGLDDDGLFCDLDGEPPETILMAIREHRDSIAALLRPGPDGFTGESWWSLYDEFTATAESDGLTQAEAERIAFDGVVGWLADRRYPQFAPRRREDAEQALADEFGLCRPVPATPAEPPAVKVRFRAA